MAAHDRPRIRPLVALRKVRALLRDPENTSLVFEIVDALKGRQELRMMQRMCASDSGRRILEQPGELLEVVSDRERLRSLPTGSLGRAYAEFMDREQISAEGLVQASDRARRLAGGRSEAAEKLRRRMRDSHDLWHVVTGYGRDLLGEASLLAFTYAQTRNRGVGFIVLVAWMRAPAAARRAIGEGFRRGRRAAWLPAVDWESLIDQPLDRVREKLQLECGPTPIA